jgi:hypothetical protein
MSRKTVSFHQLLRYINAPLQKGRQAISHNLRSAFDYLPQIEAEFLQNYNHIRNQPKGGVVLYHEIIALAEADREKVTEEMLIDLTREYLRRRAPNALAYAKAQFDTDSPHVHILISGNLIESAKKLRIERGAFERIKREMEAYQIEKYPQLSHSIVYGKQRQKAHDRPRLTNLEAERARRLQAEGIKKPSQKEDVRERLKACLIAANTEEHLIELLKAAQFAPYVRGKTPGVTDTRTGRKYRLNTLGLDREGQETVSRLRANQPQPERTQARLQKVEDIKLAKVQRQWLRLGFREEIAAAIQTPVPPAAGRERDLHAIRQRRRERQRARGLDTSLTLTRERDWERTR